MLLYCLKCKKDTESIDPNILKTSNEKRNTFIEMCSV